MKRALVLCVLALACKKREAVQQPAPEHTEAEEVGEVLAQQRAARAKALEEYNGAGDAGTVPWGREDSNGSFGAGGLSLTGGTQSDGGATPAGSSMIRQGTTTVEGRLPPEVIQRIVRQRFGRFKLCYTTALRANPSLQGRVTIKYVIDRDGSVKGTPQDAGSDLPDRGAIDCIVREFQNLSYPAPQGGIVTVVYPLIFSPAS